MPRNAPSFAIPAENGPSRVIPERLLNDIVATQSKHRREKGRVKCCCTLLCVDRGYLNGGLMLSSTIRSPIYQQSLGVFVGRYIAIAAEGEEDAAHGRAEEVAIEFWC
jgi:hypothetical protein